MSRKDSILALSALCVLCQFCFPQSQPVRPGQPRTRPPYMQQLKSFEETQYVAKAVLKNGLTVLVNEVRSVPVAAILTRVRAGYFNEPEEIAGVSQVLEHMVYRGTAARAAGVIAKETRALGGILNASTDYDHTTFQTVVPAAQWKKALEMQADAVFNSVLDGEILKREIDIVRQEERGKLDNPGIFASKKLFELVFPKHRGGQWSLETLHNLSRDKMLDYHRMTYNPGRMILAISGDVNTSEVLTEVVRLYGKTRSGPDKKDPSRPEAEQAGFRYLQIREAIQLPRVLIGFRTAPATSEDYPALVVLDALLSLGKSSTLTGRLQEQKRIIIRGSTELVAFADLGYLSVHLEVDPKNLDRCEIATFTELEILKRQQPDAADMARALAQLERKYWSGLQTVQGRAATLTHFEAREGWKGMNDFIPRLKRIKPEDISRVAAKYLRLENCALLEYLPTGMEPRALSTEGIHKTIQELLQSATEQELAAREKTTVEAVDIPQSPSAFKFSEVRFPLQKASVMRGPELFIREDHTSPLLYMGLFFPGGKLFEKKENAGITSLMLHSILKGSKERKAEQLYRQLEVYGGSITPVVADDYFGLFFSILSPNIESGLDLLLDLIKSPKFDAEDIAREKELQLARIRRQKDSTLASPRTKAENIMLKEREGSPLCSERSHPFQLLDQALFGSFPYGLDEVGSETSVVALTSEAVQAWYKSTVDDRKPVAVIVGDTQGTSLARYFVRNFSGSRYQDVKISEDFAKALEKRALVEEEWNKGHGLILVGFQAPPDGDEDSYPLILLENHASGPGGRLAEELRDKGGLAYYVSLQYRPRLRGGSIVALAETVPQNEDKILKALEEEIRRLVETPISYRDYRSAVNASVGAYWIDRQSRSAEITAITRSFLSGKGIDGITDYPTRLQSVKQEDLQEIAKRVFKLEKSVVVHLRGKPK